MTRGEGGGIPTTDIERSKAHIEYLQSVFSKLSVRHIALLAGLGESTLNHALRTGRIGIESEALLLAVTTRHVHLRPPTYADPALAYQHIRRLMEIPGCTTGTISEASGVDLSAISPLAGGHRKLIAWSTQQAILSCSPSDVRRRLHWTTYRDSILRIRALQAHGYTLSLLSSHLSTNINSFVGRDPARRLRQSEADKVYALYEELRDTPGPSQSAAMRAASAGYLPPEFFDDDMRMISKDDVKNRKKQSKARDFLRAIGLSIEGRSATEITEATGLTERTISDARRHAGITLEQGYVMMRPKETRPGALSAARAAIARVDYWTPVDAADEPGLDYVALLESLAAPDVDEAVA